MQNLIDWCSENLINLEVLQANFLFGVKTLDKKFLLLDNREKLFNKNQHINLTDLDITRLEEYQPDYFLFEFGTQFYYSKLIEQENEFNETVFKIEFNDFKYLGNAIGCEDNNFPYIGIHTEYELLNGSHKSDYWVKKAKFLGYKEIAICDKNTLAGTLAFQLSCVKENIKSIIGATYVVAHDYKDGQKEIPETSEVLLFVKNETGWQNILQINKCVNVDYDKFIPEEKLLQYSEGLVCVFNKESRINHYRNVKQGKAIIKQFKAKFDDLFYQIDPVEYYSDSDDLNNLENIKFYIENYFEILDPVLICDTYYLDKNMYALKETLNKLSKKALAYSEDQYFKTKLDIEKQFKPLFKNIDFDSLFDICIENLKAISNHCNYSINTGEHKIPKYKFSDIDNETLFFDLIEKGVNKKLKNVKNIDVYMDRIERESTLIVNAGFVDYFLILWDIVSWSKENEIMVGTGRGSIGGCLVAYLIDITEVDPIKHDLLFERFLNETRVSGERAKMADSMPDVDLDFASEKRDDVKNYIKERFGKNHTCNIGTFGRLKLKGALKDFARLKGIDFSTVNYITKSIDDEQEYTFTDFIHYALKNDDLYRFMQKYPEMVHLIKYCLGQAKTESIHASAVIIVPEEDKNGNKVDIFNYLPIRKIDGVLVSEWEGKYTDRAGFLKEDILGLSQLDKFKFTLDLIRKNHKKEIDLNLIDLNHKETYKLFQDGYTEDVFQFGSVGLKKYSLKAKPENIEDLTAMTSLYRPGPMDSNAHNDFADIKQGKKKPKYDFGLKEVTQNTFGLLVYQEQIMKSVVVLGGFTLVESDTFRTAIKKFDKKTMDAFKDKFLKGAKERGCEEKEADKIWNKLLAFSGYGFNKSHALAYSLISYQSQWLKANYPLEFWTSSLNFSKDDLVVNRVQEIHKLKNKFEIEIKPPDVNYSKQQFDCNTDARAIYWSLSKIKNLGDAVVTKIINERNLNGLFGSYDDFVKRMPKKDCNKKHITCLILSGAFDSIENIAYPEERKLLLDKHFKRTGTEVPEKFLSKNNDKRYFWVFEQKELIGYGDVSYKEILMQNKHGKKYIDYYVSAEKFQKLKDYDEVLICGVVNFIKVLHTKKDKQPFLKLEILHNNEILDVICWNDFYEENQEYLDNCLGDMIGIFGKIRFDKTYKMCNQLYTNEDSFIIKL